MSDQPIEFEWQRQYKALTDYRPSGPFSEPDVIATRILVQIRDLLAELVVNDRERNAKREGGL